MTRATAYPRPFGIMSAIRAQIDRIADTVRGEQWLPGATRVLTPNRYWRAHRAELVKPVEALVWHYTASPWATGKPYGSDFERVKRWARGRGRESSTHVTYLRDGRRIQLMPFGDRAWHVVDRFPHPMTGRPLNPDTLAMDLENVGFLTQRGSGFYNDYDGLHRGPVGFDESGRPWEAPTDEQLRAIEDDAPLIARWFPQLGDGSEGRVIRHSDAQATRSDPGPLFDVDWYAGLLEAAS